MGRHERGYRSLLLAALVACLAMMASCTAALIDPTAPPADAAPAFKAGYGDGCVSGFADAGREGMQLDWRRDEQRFAADAQYQRGWESGHRACYEEERRNPKMYGGETS